MQLGLETDTFLLVLQAGTLGLLAATRQQVKLHDTQSEHSHIKKQAAGLRWSSAQ